jgi:hypothetical protein
LTKVDQGLANAFKGWCWSEENRKILLFHYFTNLCIPGSVITSTVLLVWPKRWFFFVPSLRTNQNWLFWITRHCVSKKIAVVYLDWKFSVVFGKEFTLVS